MKKERQTWQQYRYKKTMDLFRDVKNLRIKFHFAFWRPLAAIGGPIRFGLYVEYDEPEQDEIVSPIIYFRIGGHAASCGDRDAGR